MIYNLADSKAWAQSEARSAGLSLLRGEGIWFYGEDKSEDTG